MNFSVVANTVADRNFLAKMNEVVASSSMSWPYTHLLIRCSNRRLREKGEIRPPSEEERDLQTRTRTNRAVISRNIGFCVCPVLLYSDLRCLLISLRQEARVMLEEIMAETAQDSSMGDLTAMPSRRDVRSPSYLAAFLKLIWKKERYGLAHRRIWRRAYRGLADEIHGD